MEVKAGEVKAGEVKAGEVKAGLDVRRAAAAASLSAVLFTAGCADLGPLRAGEPDLRLSNAMAGTPAGATWSDPGAHPPVSASPCLGDQAPEPTPGLGVKTCYWHVKNLIDNVYRQYKIDLFHAVGEGSLAADTLSQALNVAGVITPGATAAKLFGALAGGVSAVKGYVNSDILYKQTITIVIHEMDTDRDDVNTANAKDLADQDPMSWGQALNDLLTYYEAGTFQHAMVTLESKAGQSSTGDQAQANAAADAIAKMLADKTAAAEPAAAEPAAARAGKTAARAARAPARLGAAAPAMLVVPILPTHNGDRRTTTAGGNPAR